MEGDGQVTIILATTAAPNRRASLRRALESVRTQTEDGVRPLVVVNGDRFDPEMVAELKGDPGVEFRYREEGSLPAAIFYGRRQVETEYFGFLDDDDFLLPDAIRIRRVLIDADSGYDVAVTAGYRQSGDRRIDYDIDVAHCRENSLKALTEKNWLASCAGLYRSATVGPAYFENLQKYAEWTDAGFRLAIDRKINFGNDKTYVIDYSEDSLSKHGEFVMAPQLLLRRFLRSPLPPGARRMLRRKYVDELHNASEHCRENGQYLLAWSLHLRCLATRGGIKYLPFTRHLLLPR